METLELIQGTPEWHEERLKSFTASEAPMMMGDSKYVSRDELLKYKKTGVSQIVSSYQQKIFDGGHASEAAARVIRETELGEDLFPIVGVTVIEGMRFLASYDGTPFSEEWCWEHKQYNKTLFENVRHEVLEDDYIWQLEHQILVMGDDCEYVEFVCSDGTADESKRAIMRYYSQPEYRERLISGWKQFAKDLETYEVKALEEVVEVEKNKSLPMVKIEVSGKVVASNLPEFRAQALEFIDNINTNLVTDADFEQAKADVKACEKAEKQLKEAKERALAETGSIAELFEAIDEITEKLREKRLKNNTNVTNRMKTRKQQIVDDAQAELNVHFNECITDLRGYTMPALNFDFHAAIKGKSKISSMESAVNDMLAEVKRECTQHMEKMLANLAIIDTDAKGHEFLFRDFDSFINRESDYVKLTVKSRMDEYKKSEEEKAKVKDAIEALRNACNVDQAQTVEENINIVQNEIDRLSQLVLTKEEFGDFLQEAMEARSFSVNKLETDLAAYQSMIEENNKKSVETSEPEATEIKLEKAEPEVSAEVEGGGVSTGHIATEVEEVSDPQKLGTTENPMDVDGDLTVHTIDTGELPVTSLIQEQFNLKPGLYAVAFKRIGD